MEWIKIFSSAAEAVGRVPPGKLQLLVIMGRRICLANHNGVFMAVQDSCSHNGESLSKGTVNYLGEVICPWHNYRFDLRSGKACDSSSPDLKTYAVKVDEQGLFVGVE
jgi:nitrite reductase/ring-hydroxylating ferredoxin subunit